MWTNTTGQFSTLRTLHLVREHVSARVKIPYVLYRVTAYKRQAVVYQVDVKERNMIKTYYGLTENAFKDRFYAHKSSFKHDDKRGSTELSKYVWSITDRVQGPAPLGTSYPTALGCLEAGVFNIKWSIKSKGVPYQPGAKYCDLCLEEKTTIVTANPKTTLNTRSEILYMCKHKEKYTLAKLKSKNSKK